MVVTLSKYFVFNPVPVMTRQTLYTSLSRFKNNWPRLMIRFAQANFLKKDEFVHGNRSLPNPSGRTPPTIGRTRISENIYNPGGLFFKFKIPLQHMAINRILMINSSFYSLETISYFLHFEWKQQLCETAGAARRNSAWDHQLRWNYSACIDSKDDTVLYDIVHKR